MNLPHEILADRLMEAGLAEMSHAARNYRYHDFRSGLDSPALALANELHAAAKATQDPERRDKIHAIYKAHMQGEWDATKAESDDWAEGPDGQLAFRELMGKRGDRA